MKKWLKSILWKERDIFIVAGDIAERFVEKYDDKMETTAKYDDLQEKLDYWIRCGYFK